MYIINLIDIIFITKLILCIQVYNNRLLIIIFNINLFNKVTNYIYNNVRVYKTSAGVCTFLRFCAKTPRFQCDNCIYVIKTGFNC